MINSKELKKYLQAIDPTVRVNSIPEIRHGIKGVFHIQAWSFHSTKEFRTIALHTIYGDDFELNDQAIAGNVQENYVSMSPIQWEETIKKLEGGEK